MQCMWVLVFVRASALYEILRQTKNNVGKIAADNKGFRIITQLNLLHH